MDTLLVIFEGVGNRLKKLWFSKDFLGDPRLREDTQGVVIQGDRVQYTVSSLLGYRTRRM